MKIACLTAKTGCTWRGNCDCEFSYTTEQEVFPQAISGCPWLPHSSWHMIYASAYIYRATLWFDFCDAEPERSEMAPFEVSQVPGRYGCAVGTHRKAMEGRAVRRAGKSGGGTPQVEEQTIAPPERLRPGGASILEDFTSSHRLDARSHLCETPPSQ
jgi:hypothetical protein